MAEFKLKEGYGYIFKNENKTEEKQPDATGEINIDGKVRNMAIWYNKDKSKKHIMTFKVSEKQQKGFQSQPTNEVDDDLPF